MGTPRIQLTLVFFIWVSSTCLSSTLPTDFSILNQPPAAGESISEVRVAELFQQWKQKYGKVYKNGLEAEKRFRNFWNNLKYVIEKNKNRNKDRSEFTVGLNKFADLSNEEFREIYTSKVKKPSNKTMTVERKGKKGVAACEGPSSLDWRKYGVVTGVKDQGDCGMLLLFFFCFLILVEIVVVILL